MPKPKTFQQKLDALHKVQAKLDRIVQKATKAVVAAIRDQPPPLKSHFFYGASAVHPKHLVTWYIFATDAELRQARENGLGSRLDELTRAELAARGYPAEGVPLMMVSLESDETIRRESGGDYWQFFK
jgi:hypothetical protein